MALLFRFLGWGLFVTGTAIFFLNGSTSNLQDPLTKVAMVLMPAGILCTSVSLVLAWRQKMKAMEREMLHPAPPAPSAPAPDPSKPEKHYAARPLDPAKVEKPDKPADPA